MFDHIKDTTKNKDNKTHYQYNKTLKVKSNDENSILNIIPRYK
jgi:hypothetical protein